MNILTNQKLKIIFWGTPEFALPSLEALINPALFKKGGVKNGYEISAVITNPDEPVGRKQILTPPPVKIFAQKHKIPVFQPSKLEIGNWKLEIPRADLYVVAAYGKIIPKAIIELPRFGSLNIHPSLLPRWRGASPIQYTILNGDAETGVTIIEMDELMDHGPIVAVSEIIKLEPKITYQKLHDKLAELGADLLVKTLPKWVKGEITPQPQNDSEATFSKILKKEDGQINWSRPAEEIEQMVRAFNPWPGSWTTWPTQRQAYRIKIEETGGVSDDMPDKPNGYVWQNDSFPVAVKTGRKSLIIQKLTLEGKKTQNADSFVQGYPQIINSLLV